MNTLPKITLVGPAHPYRGGLAAYNERLAQALIKQGFDVNILTFTLQYPNFLFPGKTQFASWEAPNDLKIDRSLNSVNPLSWLNTAKKAVELDTEILLFKYWLPFMGPAFGSVSCLAKRYNKAIKSICILDNVIPHEKRIGDKVFTRYFINRIDGFIGMSHSVLDDLNQFDQVKPRLYNPHPIFDNFGDSITKTEACASLNLDPDVNYLLFFGIIRDYKGLDWLLDAYSSASFDKNKIKLIVAGEFYTDSSPYKEKIKHLNLEEHVILHERFVPDNEVNNYFCAADMIVQPYKHATQSGVTQIGYHFEKPMLVTNVGGLGEIIPHLKGGYVVEPSIHAIKDAMEDFYANNRLNEMTNGIRSEKQRFSWDRMTEQIQKLINSL